MILIVDDIRANIIALQKILELHGLVADAAESGEEALLKILKSDYSLIILDVQMPGMDGLEATRRIRATGFGAPIVALTADAMPEDAARCLAAGMQAHLAKPVSRAQLEKMLHRWAGARAVV